jgi:hypothetical protein
MDMNPSRKELFLYTFPILLSALSEHLLLLTDVLLLSFQEKVYLAAVGFVDAFLLCSLALGFALNDSFQNFYARNTQKTSLSYPIYRKSLRSFLLISLLIGVCALLLVWLFSFTQQNRVYQEFLDVAPYIVPLIAANFISLAMNAYLLANDRIKTVGTVSIIVILTNALLGYLLLFIFRLPFSPLLTILISSFISELIGIALMHSAIQKMKPSVEVKLSKRPGKLFNLLHRVALYPAFSEFLFHLGSFALFVFCAHFFTDNEIAHITLLLAYWGVMMVPVETFSETGLNFFARIFAGKVTNGYFSLKTKIFQTACFVAIALFIMVCIMDIVLVNNENSDLIELVLLLVIVLISAHNQLILTAMLTKLKTTLFGLTKVIYGTTVIICLCLLVFFWKAHATSVFLSFLVGQFVIMLFLLQKEKSIQ